MTARVLGDFPWVAVISASVLGDHLQIAELTAGACLQIAPRSWFGPLALGIFEGLPLMRHRSWTLSPIPTNLKDFHFRATHLKD